MLRIGLFLFSQNIVTLYIGLNIPSLTVQTKNIAA
jgi:hypothetical protein